jgi:transposase-like protein
MARPTKYRPAVKKKIVQAIKMGATHELAACYAGIAESTLHQWMTHKRSRGLPWLLPCSMPQSDTLGHSGSRASGTRGDKLLSRCALLVAPAIIAALAAAVCTMRAQHRAAVNAGVIVGSPSTRRAGWFFATFYGNLVLGGVPWQRSRLTQPFVPALPGDVKRLSVITSRWIGGYGAWPMCFTSCTCMRLRVRDESSLGELRRGRLGYFGVKKVCVVSVMPA